MFPIDWRRRQFIKIFRVLLIVLILSLTLYYVNLYTVLYFTHKDIYKTVQLQHSIQHDLEDGVNLAMDDPRIIKKLLSDFILPPPKFVPDHTYHLEHPNVRDPSKGQSEVIRKLLHNMTNGFFIECGALDGETRSNTLYLERFLNWSGLLIEGDPLNFDKMVKKNRKAWLSSTCLSKVPYPQKVSFQQSFNLGRISLFKSGLNYPGYVDVQCFPLFSYLAALNISHVDYFSLDVEGDELDVLWTIPFDKVDITTLSVEFSHVDMGKEALRKFMELKDYSVVDEVTHPGGLANDFIFMKNIH